MCETIKMKIEKLSRVFNSGSQRSQRYKKNVIVSVILKGLSILLSLVIVPLTLSYLTKFEYGIWLTLNSILLWINYFDIGLGNGLRNKLTEAIAVDDWNKGKSYVSTTFFLLFVIVLGVVIIFAAINQFIDWNIVLNTKDTPIHNINTIVLIVFTMCCINFVIKTIGIVHVAFQQPMVNDMLSFLGQFLSFVSIWVVVSLTESNLMYIAVCYSASPVIAYLIAYPYTFHYKYKKLAPSIGAINLKYTKVLGGMGIQFFILQIACLILYSTSNLIITRWFGAEEVTPYNIAYRYMTIATMLFVIIVNPLWSAITDAYARKEYQWIRNSINKMTKLWGVFLIFLVLMITISQFVFKLWLGDKVYIPYTLLWSIFIFVSIDLWNKIYASFSCGVGHLKLQIYSAIWESIIFIPLAWILSEYVGVNGVVLGLGIVSLIPAVILYIDYKKVINTK